MRDQEDEQRLGGGPADLVDDHGGPHPAEGPGAGQGEGVPGRERQHHGQDPQARGAPGAVQADQVGERPGEHDHGDRDHDRVDDGRAEGRAEGRRDVPAAALGLVAEQEPAQPGLGAQGGDRRHQHEGRGDGEEQAGGVGGVVVGDDQHEHEPGDGGDRPRRTARAHHRARCGSGAAGCRLPPPGRPRSCLGMRRDRERARPTNTTPRTEAAAFGSSAMATRSPRRDWLSTASTTVTSVTMARACDCGVRRGPEATTTMSNAWPGGRTRCRCRDR